MYEQDQKIKKYVNAVKRRLRMPGDVRARVVSDFESSIAARREAGESVDQVLKSLGTPKQAAAELNGQMEEYTYRKSPWRFLFLVLIIVGALYLLGKAASMALVYAMTGSEAASLGIIGGADGPTTVFVTTSVAVPTEETKMIVGLTALAAGIFGFWKSTHLKKK